MPDTDNEAKKLEIAKEELKIVRKFLRRNKVEEMCTVLAMVGDVLHSAKVFTGAVPVDGAHTTTIPFSNVQWDSDGYYDAGNPTRLTVPVGLGGRYFIQVAIRWHNPEESDVPPPFDPTKLRDSHFYAYVSLNGAAYSVGADARSTAVKVCHEATYTTQHFTFDVDLADEDFLEVRIRQDFYDPVRADAFFTIRRVGG